MIKSLMISRGAYRFPPTWKISVHAAIDGGVLALCSGSLEIGESVTLSSPGSEYSQTMQVAWVRGLSPNEYRIALIGQNTPQLSWDSANRTRMFWIRSEGVRIPCPADLLRISSQSITFLVPDRLPVGRVLCEPIEKGVDPVRLRATKVAPCGKEFMVGCVIEPSVWDFLWGITAPELHDQIQQLGAVSMSAMCHLGLITLVSLFVPVFM